MALRGFSIINYVESSISQILDNQSFSRFLLTNSLKPCLAGAKTHLSSKICNISAGETTMGVLGKCFALPVMTKDPSFERATS